MAPVDGPTEIEAAMRMLGSEPGGGLIAPSDGFLLEYRKLIIELAARYRARTGISSNQNTSAAINRRMRDPRLILGMGRFR